MERKLLVSVNEAREIILRALTPIGSEKIPLSEAQERILAEDVVAGADIPGADNSSMDGYAIRVEDPAMAERTRTPLRLHVIGESAAGTPFDRTVELGEAVRIMTGGLIPRGADAVIEIERVREQNGEIVFDESVKPGRHIRRVGNDVRKGETVISRGTRLRSFHVGILASLGQTTVAVARRPRARFITTGTELVDAAVVPEPGQVRNASAYMIPAMLAEAGALCVDHRTEVDDPEKLRALFSEISGADLLVTSGGVSVGKYDHVLQALEGSGVVFQFWKVNIKPGMPMAFGVARTGMPVFCLPGNTVSTAVTFLQFVRPAVLAMQGAAKEGPRSIPAELEHEVVKRDDKVHYSRGILTVHDGICTVRATGDQSSGVLSSLVKANCLFVLTGESRTIPQGTRVEVELL